MWPLASVLGGAAAESIGAVAKPVEAVGNVLDALFTSDEERLTKQEAMERLRQQPMLAQVELNKMEAQHQSVFVAGWRPAVGWVCAVSLGTYFIPMHTLAAVLWVRMCWNAQALVAYPIGTDALMELVFALLGMGVIRQVDKAMRGTK